MKLRLGLGVALALFTACYAPKVQAQTNDTTTAITCVSSNWNSSTATFGDGTRMSIHLAPGYQNEQEVIVQLPGEAQITTVFMPLQFSAVYKFPTWTVGIEPFSVTTQYGHVVNVDAYEYVAQVSGHSGRGGGNVYKVTSGLAMIQF